MAVLTDEQAIELREDMREAFELATKSHPGVKDRSGDGTYRWTDPIVAVAFFAEIRAQRKANIYAAAMNANVSRGTS